MSPNELIPAFQRAFGGEPEALAVAPGRINLIGEHTDYNDGFVFPVAIDRGLYVAARRTDGPTRLHSEQLGDGQSFDAGSVQLGEVHEWAAYVAGMAWVLREHSEKPLPNIEAVVHSQVPIGSGVSSSAALELAFGVLWNDVADLAIEPKQLALLGQKCENEYVGVQCGIMDQMASAMGREGKAMFLDTRSLEITYAPVPGDLYVVLCDTKTPRALTDSAYNERRQQCERAAQIMGKKSLRDASLDELDQNSGRMPEVVYSRALHVITENARCEEFVEALEKHDYNAIGRLMKASHVSLRDDYEVSSRELDLMVEACWPAPGCVGARMTGAGFGGACVAFVKRDQIDDFVSAALPSYKASSGIEGELIPCRVVDGAHVLKL